jgi:hypothetical protein
MTRAFFGLGVQGGAPYRVTVPTVFRSGPYRFFFYSMDGSEPPHVHVSRDDRSAKFWLGPARLEENSGFPTVELNRIAKLIDTNAHLLLKAWNEFFSR